MKFSLEIEIIPLRFDSTRRTVSRERERATWCNSLASRYPNERLSGRSIGIVFPHCQGTPFGSEMKERERERGFTIGRKQFSSIATVSSRNLRRRRLIKPLSCADIKSEVITVARVGYLIPRPILLIRLCFQSPRFKRAARLTQSPRVSRAGIHVYMERNRNSGSLISCLRGSRRGCIVSRYYARNVGERKETEPRRFFRRRSPLPPRQRLIDCSIAANYRRPGWRKEEEKGEEFPFSRD